MALATWLMYFLAGGLRLWLSSSSLASIIKSSIEVSTPLNSWKRVTEGVYLYRLGFDPYSGSLFHETPIGLIVFKYLIENVSHVLLVLVACDYATAYFLYVAARVYSKDLHLHQELNKKKYAADTGSILINKLDLEPIAHYVAWMFLFNPYTIMNCVAMTTTVLTNLFLALAIMSAAKGNRIISTCSLALTTYQSFYPIILLVPVALYIIKTEGKNKEINYNDTSVWYSLSKTIICFAVWFGILMWISVYITGNWKFLSSVYGFILMITDLTPNLGLFWYFFTEVFDHFYIFFVCTFQINVFIYVIPLSIRFRHEPMLLYFSLCCLMAVFKSYPSVGDIAFYLAFLPLWKHLNKYMRQSFVIGGFFLACSILGPITRYLWLYAGSANANFYFGITLAFATGQIFLLTDILFAYTKREFHLRNGVTLTVNGEPAKIVLT